MSSNDDIERFRREIDGLLDDVVRRQRYDLPDVDIIEFVTSDRFLNKPRLYPKQGTVLKVWFLQDQIFTQYDYDTIGQWEEDWRKSADERGEGNHGLVPGTLERIKIAKEEGREHFGEVLAIFGRRGSKNYLGALSLLYLVYGYVRMGNPQAELRLHPRKVLTGLIFAGQRRQALDNQFREVASIVQDAPIFVPLLEDVGTDVIRIHAPADFEKPPTPRRGGRLEPFCTFEIVAKESTAISGRGPAVIFEVFDEAAHIVATGANRSLDEVYDSARPAMDEFGIRAFSLLPSSPWQKASRLHQLATQVREMRPDGTPYYPEKILVQLESWDIYDDFERAHEIEMRPGGPMFQPIDKPVQAYDDQMRREERANPETFAVERRAHWAAVQDNYISPALIDPIWQPWPSPQDKLRMAIRGSLDTTYRGHVDPGKSGASTGVAIAHVAGWDDRGLPHAVFDVLQAFDPQDYPEGIIDYRGVTNNLARLLDDFMPSELSFDQFNSIETIQVLRSYVQGRKYPKRVNIIERPATASLNWNTFETFKTALNLGLVHSPYLERLELELQFLQERNGKVMPSSSGPCTTKDLVDCVAIVTYELIGEAINGYVHEGLSDLQLGASQPAGGPLSASVSVFEQLSGVGRSRARFSPGAPRSKRTPQGMPERGRHWR
jgi:hypothetical protein